ncbi:MAG: efflux RND transporter periplasmic adaptor subunit [Bacteroidales bacterium]|jgi:HlyD family secretion protein
MKRKTLVIIGVIALVVIAVFFIILKISKKDSLATFDTVKVQRGNIANTVTATGTIQAIKTISVGTQVSGIIQKIYVDFNDVVKKGQLMARLDTTPNESQLEQSQAARDQAQAQLDYMLATYERLKALFEKNLIAKADYDQAKYNYENAKGNLANAISAVTRAQINLAYCTITAPIDGVVLDRAIEEGQTVASSFSTPTLFSVVNDLTHMQVQTSVDEADIGKIRNGERVEFTVDAYPDNKFTAVVSQVRLQPVTTNNVVTYVVILNAPNPDKKLMPGMTASATIFVDEKENALFLAGKAMRFTPSAAYMQKMMAEFKKMREEREKGRTANAATPGQILPAGQPGQAGAAGQGTYQYSRANGGTLPANVKRVWIKNDKGGIRPTMVTTGIDNGTNVEILSGLKEGDEVVYSMNDGSAQAVTTTTTSSSTNRPRGIFPF